MKAAYHGVEAHAHAGQRWAFRLAAAALPGFGLDGAVAMVVPGPLAMHRATKGDRPGPATTGPGPDSVQRAAGRLTGKPWRPRLRTRRRRRGRATNEWSR